MILENIRKSIASHTSLRGRPPSCVRIPEHLKGEVLKACSFPANQIPRTIFGIRVEWVRSQQVMPWVVGLLALLLAGCASIPQPPKVVTKVVTEYRDLPGWATEQVANAPPANQSVKAITESNNRRGETLDYVNCRSRLLAKLGKGESVNSGECKL